jgi:hypothetical protein
MPARVREVTQKLHPAGGGDEILAAAWLALFGSVVGGRIGFYVARILADTDADYLRARIVVGGLTTVVALGGYLLVIGVIRRVELLSEERAAVAGANVAPPAGTEPAAPAAILPSSSFGDGRTVEFLTQRASAAASGTTGGAPSPLAPASPAAPPPAPSSPPTPGADAGPGGTDPPPDEPRRPA